MADRTYYVICEDNCKFESMTKEQIYAAIEEATGNVPTGVDDAFITKVKESNANAQIQFWVGTEAQFNAITPAVSANTFQLRRDSNGKWYAITDLDPYTPKKVTISLPTASWTGSASPYTQVVTIQGSTVNSKIDLQPDSTALAQMINDGTAAIYIENNNNVLTAYAVGDKPTADLSVQAIMYEVTT